MRAVVDSMKGSFVRCLIENGDMINISKKLLPEGITEGDVLKVSFSLDKAATARQKQLITSYKA